ncbi:MAG: hypothetical protein HKN47_00325 [Pirellulaceae bacterium]|nr:hypothetical protein [Pirellulaceae bacterium]
MQTSPSIALVTTTTRLKGLLSKFGTKGAARFRLKSSKSHFALQNDSTDAIALSADADFDAYVAEDDQYRRAVDAVEDSLHGLGYTLVDVERRFLATYDFRHTHLVVVVGPDGLVANTAKYVGDIPIVAINPDPSRIDGVLLPFGVDQTRNAVVKTLDQQSKIREITLARVQLPDGQSMLAFNDFFIGRRSHVSSRYVLYNDGRSEVQSSSGMIVSTGAGSTGWLSSVFNMSRGITQWIGGDEGDPLEMTWSDRRLAWIVREPFASRTTGVEMVAGTIDEPNELRVESLMPESGVIFSDGIENDFLEFNSGAIAEIDVAPQRSRLVVS